MTPEQVRALLEVCRGFGVSKLAIKDVCIEFFQPLALLDVVVPESEPKLIRTGSVGADGLTAEEQADLFGHVLDAKP